LNNTNKNTNKNTNTNTNTKQTNTTIRDPKLNIREDLQNVAFQFVQYVEWETTASGRKEMVTTFPTLLTIAEDATVWDLR